MSFSGDFFEAKLRVELGNTKSHRVTLAWTGIYWGVALPFCPVKDKRLHHACGVLDRSFRLCLQKPQEVAKPPQCQDTDSPEWC